MTDPEFFQVECEAVDQDGEPLPSPVGPFTSSAEAARWSAAQRVREGAEFEIRPLRRPAWPDDDLMCREEEREELIERLARPLAAIAVRRYAEDHPGSDPTVESFLPDAREDAQALLDSGAVDQLKRLDTGYLFLRMDFGNWLLSASDPDDAVAEFRKQRPGEGFRAFFQELRKS